MPKTIDQFTNERKEVVQKIFNILEITPINKMISLKKLDEDNEKQNKIIELETDVQKYFISSQWNYFKNKNRDFFKRRYLSLIKAVMKDMNVKMVSSVINRKIDDGNIKADTYYIFEV
jgi:hypothetical protein